MSTYSFNVKMEPRSSQPWRQKMSTDSSGFWSLNLLWFLGIRISGRTHSKDGNGTAKVAHNTARFTMSFLWVSNLFWHSFQPSLLSAAVSTVNIRTGINKCVVFKRILCSFPLFYLNMLCYALPNFKAKTKCQPLLWGEGGPWCCIRCFPAYCFFYLYTWHLFPALGFSLCI